MNVATATTTPTVLIVDDEDLFRSSIRDALESKYPHFQVLEAGNGQEALEQLESSTADVVLTDINMPVMDGFNLLIALRNQQFTGSVITVTAFGNPRLAREVKRSGAFAYMDKPVDLSQLLELVGNTAEKRQTYVEGLALQGFVQLIGLENRSCRLRISHQDRDGELVFELGRLIHAQVGDLSGNDAAREILSWEQQSPIELMIGNEPVPRTVTKALDALLISAAPLTEHDEFTDAEFWDAETQGFAEVSSNGHSLPHQNGTAPKPADSQLSTAELFNFESTDAEELDSSHSTNNGKEVDMGNVKDSLEEAMKIEGAIGISLVDFESGMTLGKAGGGDALNLDIASAGNTAVVRSKIRVMKDLGLDDTIEDILISLGTQYHLIRPLVKEPNLFLYFALDRERANLGMARHRLNSIEKNLSL